MPFRPEPVQPEFNDLITSLSNSKSQIQNNPLYQTIFTLIKRLTVSKDLTQKQIKDIDETLDNVLSATFLTVDDESNLLVNSRREIAGLNITFDDTVPHIRKVSSSGGTTIVGGNTPIFMPFGENEDFPTPIEFMGNFPLAATSSSGVDLTVVAARVIHGI